MAKIVSGTFNGTGLASYICLGFVPDWVRIRGLESSTLATLRWSKNFRAADCDNGVEEHVGSTYIQPAAATAGTAIEPYFGGDKLTSTTQPTLTYGGQIYYLGWDLKDYRGTDIAAGSDAIGTWTLDTSGNRTGHFNNDVVGTYIGEGSRITIDGRDYLIEALTAGQGIAANEVTLNYAVATGDVERISGMYDLAAIPVGNVTPAGFKLNMTTPVNATGEMQWFEAGLYDN
jgi:hypothetical protein